MSLHDVTVVTLRNCSHLTQKFYPRRYQAEKQSKFVLAYFIQNDIDARNQGCCNRNGGAFNSTHPPAVARLAGVARLSGASLPIFLNYSLRRTRHLRCEGLELAVNLVVLCRCVRQYPSNPIGPHMTLRDASPAAEHTFSRWFRHAQ
jgi:hypothetical protein